MSARVLKYAPSFAPNSDLSTLDYVRGLAIRLQPKMTFNKGELVQRQFYESAVLEADGSQTFSGLAVQEDVVYTRDANGLVQSRVMTITWYNEDGSVALTKTRNKLYTPLEGLREGKRMRGNNFDQLQIDTLGMIMMTTGWDIATAQADGGAFMMSLQSESTNYVEADDAAGLIAAINASSVATFVWLDNDVGGITIRQYLVAGLS